MITYLCKSSFKEIQMKKDKQKLVETARKEIRKTIKLSLIAKLKEVTAQLGGDAKKLEKEIEKASVKVAKKLSKEMKVSKSGQLEGGNEEQPALAPELPKPHSLTKENLPSAKTTNSELKKQDRKQLK